jgi:hypothetical protein
MHHLWLWLGDVGRVAIYCTVRNQSRQTRGKRTVRIIRANIVHLDHVSALDAALYRLAARERHPVDRVSVGPGASDVALQTDRLDHDGVVHGAWCIVSETTQSSRCLLYPCESCPAASCPTRRCPASFPAIRTAPNRPTDSGPWRWFRQGRQGAGGRPCRRSLESA